MNRSLLLHAIERLESVLHRLPESIRNPVLHEITPLKELFLQQRAPRILLCGSADPTFSEMAQRLFGATTGDAATVHRWQELEIADRGTLSIFDARSADAGAHIQAELSANPADVIIFIDEPAGRVKRKRAADNARTFADFAGAIKPVVVVRMPSTKTDDENASSLPDELGSRVVANFVDDGEALPARLTKVLARNVPNDSRVEMVRISGDRETQHEIAKALIKSTSVICGAVGAQPIPLADMPILTTLQLLMVSGVMYISGRERSLRAATEFVAALGANVGAGMLLREGARAILKFVPGFGNVVCGMIAAGGTFAVGRAATAYFIDQVSLKAARETYLRSRRRKEQPAYLTAGEGDAKAALPGRSRRL